VSFYRVREYLSYGCPVCVLAVSLQPILSENPEASLEVQIQRRYLWRGVNGDHLHHSEGTSGMEFFGGMVPYRNM
jgi:hypothetical protein